MILNRFKKKRERKINQNQFLKETLKKQLNSISETLQMVSLYKIVTKAFQMYYLIK